MLQRISKAYENTPSCNSEDLLFSDYYKKNLRPFNGIKEIIDSYTGNRANNSLSLSEDALYSARKNKVTESWNNLHLSKSEKAYWTKKENSLPKTYTYQYAKSYSNLIGMQGIYFVCMLSSFVIAITMSGVFMNEHTKKTDQLLLCCKKGRNLLYLVKLSAGSLISICVSLFLTLVALICNFSIYGTKGFSTMIQVASYAFTSSTHLTIGNTLIIMIILLVLSSILTALLAMILSDIFHNTIAGMATIIGLLFLARLLAIPSNLKVLSRLWNIIPINILNGESNFFDPRLISIGGLELTSWQFAPIVYVILIIGILLIGNKLHKKYQVSDR